MLKETAAALLLLAAAPAFAQDEPAPLEEAETLSASSGIDVSGEFLLLSDYRFRGVSRSDEDPAGQAALTLSHRSGFYAGARATTLKGIDGLRLRDLGDAEFDLYAGWGAPIGDGFELDAGVMYYLFAGGTGPTDYVEPYASLSYLIGPVYATAGAKYAPSQDAIGGEDMLYLFSQVDVSVPFRPWSFTLQAGRQDWGRFGCYWNWSAGVAHQLQIEGIPDTEIALRYIDTDSAAPGADATLMLSLGLRF